MLVEQLNLDRDPARIPDSEPLFRKGLGLDSVDSLEIIVAIEREFKVKINNRNLKKPDQVFKTVGTLAEFVEKLTGKK
ncbi:MAG: phosphopantetheine-binding protein [Candidatus Margulisbacteria bacterium]|nr:phosphopantetheine-binding protein [Candidatus Margulisiibacteriota bacterium]